MKQVVRGYADIGVHEVLLPDGSFGETTGEKVEGMGRFIEQVASEFR